MLEHPAITMMRRFGDISYQHDEDATFVYCSVCGKKIWSDTEDRWIESPVGNICWDCVEESTRYGEIF